MDRARAWVLPLTVLLLLLLSSGTQAQLQTCGPVTLSTEPSEVTVEPGGNATVEVTVRNEGSVDGSARLDLNVPQGWDVQPNQRTFPLAAGAAETVPVIVKASEDADRFSPPYTLEATARLDCGAAGTSDPATTTVPLHLNTTAAGGPGANVGDAGGFDLGAAGLVFLGAVAVLTALGALPYIRERRALQVEAQEPLLGVEPGQGVSFPVEVENRSGDPDTLGFEVSGVPDGWSAFIAVPELDLEAGEHRTLWVLVRAPQDAVPGDNATVRLHASSREHAKREATVELTAKVANGTPGTPVVGTPHLDEPSEG